MTCFGAGSLPLAVADPDAVPAAACFIRGYCSSRLNTYFKASIMASLLMGRLCWRSTSKASSFCGDVVDAVKPLSDDIESQALTHIRDDSYGSKRLNGTHDERRLEHGGQEEDSCRQKDVIRTTFTLDGRQPRQGTEKREIKSYGRSPHLEDSTTGLSTANGYPVATPSFYEQKRVGDAAKRFLGDFSTR